MVKMILQHFTQLTSRTCTRASLASRTLFGGADVEGKSDGRTRRTSRACSAIQEKIHYFNTWTKYTRSNLIKRYTADTMLKKRTNIHSFIF